MVKEKLTVQCAHGDVMTYPPLARVVEVEEKDLMMKAVVSDKL